MDEVEREEWLRRLSNAFAGLDEGNLLSDYPERLHTALMAVLVDAYSAGYEAGRDDVADAWEDAHEQPFVL